MTECAANQNDQGGGIPLVTTTTASTDAGYFVLCNIPRYSGGNEAYDSLRRLGNVVYPKYTRFHYSIQYEGSDPLDSIPSRLCRFVIIQMRENVGKILTLQDIFQYVFNDEMGVMSFYFYSNKYKYKVLFDKIHKFDGRARHVDVHTKRAIRPRPIIWYPDAPATFDLVNIKRGAILCYYFFEKPPTANLKWRFHIQWRMTYRDSKN